MDALHDLVDVCLGLEADLAACPQSAAVRSSRRLFRALAGGQVRLTTH